MSDDTQASGPERGNRPFRWQALLQRAGEALFVLDRRRRVLFVNHAFEQLAGLPADRARGLICRRPRPVGPDDPAEALLAHILTPPVEALQGEVARTRRLFVARAHRDAPSPPPRWWDVEFFPLRQSGPRQAYLLIGRILPVEEAPGPAASPAMLPERLESLRLSRASGYTFALLESVTPAVRRLAEQARLAGQVRAPVLLVGESGAGKQTIARIIHAHGPMREHAFAALDCRRLPPAAVADVLLAERQGPLWRALGCLYLSEPDHLPRDLQLRLCEWLATGVEAGGPRLIAGCLRDPVTEVREGRLLEELFWRMGTLTLAVPSLRDRLEDLPHLVRQILRELNLEEGTKLTGLSEVVFEAFRAYGWPGNLTELRQVLTAARMRANRPTLDVGDLPHALRLARQVEQDPAPKPGSLALEVTLQQVERRLIRLALMRARGNRSRAAELLGVHRPRLLRRMQALGLDDNTAEFEGESTCESPG